MIVMQEEEEVVDTKENKRFRATHGEIVAKVRVLVTNLPFSIITKASHYVILNTKVDTICRPTFSHVFPFNGGTRFFSIKNLIFLKLGGHLLFLFIF